MTGLDAVIAERFMKVLTFVRLDTIALFWPIITID